MNITEMRIINQHFETDFPLLVICRIDHGCVIAKRPLRSFAYMFLAFQSHSELWTPDVTAARVLPGYQIVGLAESLVVANINARTAIEQTPLSCAIVETQVNLLIEELSALVGRAQNIQHTLSRSFTMIEASIPRHSGFNCGCLLSPFDGNLIEVCIAHKAYLEKLRNQP